jgi:hypothetical protein
MLLASLTDHSSPADYLRHLLNEVILHHDNIVTIRRLTSQYVREVLLLMAALVIASLLHDTMVLAVALIQLLCHTYIAVNNND